MRAIDADHLISLITDYPEWNKFDKNRVIRMINEEPTIDTAKREDLKEIIHG